MRSRHTSWVRAIACSSTAGKRAAILHAKKYIEELSKKIYGLVIFDEREKRKL